MSIQINKVKIHKETQLKVEYTQYSTNGSIDKDAKDTYPHNIHPDLVNAFSELDVHLTHLTQQRNSTGDYANAEVYCDAYEIIRKGDNESVKLMGARAMGLTHKTLELESPAQALSEMAVELYDYSEREELKNAIDNVDAEVRLYLFEGKYAPEPEQAEMDLEGGTTEPIKKKKGKKEKITKNLEDNLEGI